MIAGSFHQGSGLGDQLHRYITVRTLAEQKGFKWGMNFSQFKGDFFKHIDKVGVGGAQTIFDYEGAGLKKTWKEKDVRENDLDIRSYDPEINFVQDHTIIDGSFEDYKYWGHNLANINKWLEVERLEIPDDVCVIGFRGGEYYSDPNLGLPKDYYDEAISIMKEKGITKFEVHTDDAALASRFFPNYPITHDIGINWRSIRFAHHAIIANSAFYILPRMLRHFGEPMNKKALTLAPRYWARRNIGVWARPACYYKQFIYI